MRVRTLIAAAVATIAVSGLAGCRSNVGTAATADGRRISESQVGDYVTASARTLHFTSQSGAALSVEPRTYALETVLEGQFLDKLLAATPAGAPSKGQLAQIRTSVAGTKSATTIAKEHGIVGFTRAFDDVWVRTQVADAALQSYSQRGGNVEALLRKVKFPVRVSPRYGRWNPSTFNIETGSTAGLPGFVTLQPTPSVAPSH